MFIFIRIVGCAQKKKKKSKSSFLQSRRSLYRLSVRPSGKGWLWYHQSCAHWPPGSSRPRSWSCTTPLRYPPDTRPWVGSQAQVARRAPLQLAALFRSLVGASSFDSSVSGPHLLLSALRQHKADGHHLVHEQRLPTDRGQSLGPLPLHQDSRVPSLRPETSVQRGTHQGGRHHH